jgi:hypothetical protein
VVRWNQASFAFWGREISLENGTHREVKRQLKFLHASVKESDHFAPMAFGTRGNRVLASNHRRGEIPESDCAELSSSWPPSAVGGHAASLRAEEKIAREKCLLRR